MSARIRPRGGSNQYDAISHHNKNYTAVGSLTPTGDRIYGDKVLSGDCRQIGGGCLLRWGHIVWAVLPVEGNHYLHGILIVIYLKYSIYSSCKQNTTIECDAQNLFLSSRCVVWTKRKKRPHTNAQRTHTQHNKRTVAHSLKFAFRFQLLFSSR